MDLDTVREHVDVAAAGGWRPGDAWLAGGTWLFSEPQPHVRRLVDLTSAGWPPLRTTAGGGLEIAATCTVAELAAHPHPLFAACARAFLAPSAVQRVATVGGNLCTALPAGPMIALTAALDGVCLLTGPDGERTVPVTEFVAGAGTTVLGPGELLRSVTLPPAALARPAAVRQASLYPRGRSAALLVGTRDGAGVTLTVTGSTVRPVRVRGADGVDGIAADLWFADVHGDADWRRHMTARLAREIVEELS
jgi:CO/xanthine dehydrogenase FAD-binding subunit